MLQLLYPSPTLCERTIKHYIIDFIGGRGQKGGGGGGAGRGGGGGGGSAAQRIRLQ